MYIRGLIPQNLAELAEAVPIAFVVPMQQSQVFSCWDPYGFIV